MRKSGLLNVKAFYLVKSQLLPIKLEVAWDFLSNPSNLKNITPPSMDFAIVGEVPPQIYEGLIIEYRVTPLPMLRSRWVSEITHVKPPNYFVDEQRIGPYAMWHHEHHLEEVEGGVKMIDKITYSLKQPIVASLIDRLIVRPKIETIFEYRSKRLEEIFGRSKG